LTEPYVLKFLVGDRRLVDGQLEARHLRFARCTSTTPPPPFTTKSTALSDSEVNNFHP